MAYALQLLIGVDKKNLIHYFQGSRKKQIHIYYGGILYEVTPLTQRNQEIFNFESFSVDNFIFLTNYHILYASKSLILIRFQMWYK